MWTISLYDGKDQRLCASCGAGFLEVFRQTDADHYEQVAKLPTVRGARTSLLVPEQRRLYLAVPQHDGQAVAIWVYRIEP